MPINLDDLELSHRELRFIKIFCTTGDPVKATKECDYVESSASDIEANIKSVEIRNDPNIQEGIRRYKEFELGPYREYFQLKLLRFLDARAFFNIRDFFMDNGAAKSLEDIPEHLLMAIDGITEDFKGKEADVRTVKLQLPNRMESIKMLKELLKETAPKVEGSTGLTTEHTDFLSSVFNKLDAETMGKAAGAAALAGFEAGKKEKAHQDTKKAEEANTVQHKAEPVMIEEVVSLDPMTRLEQELKERDVPNEPTRRRRVADDI